MSSWSYESRKGSSYGEMRCCKCQRMISEGRYRVRQKSKHGDWFYQTQHEACSADDPEWAAWDQRIADAVQQAKELSRACRDFREKWQVPELDDYIQEDDDHDRLA